MDIYGRHRYIDFALESPESKIAIEIDGETYHNPSKVSENKYADDLLKQNSLIYDNWKVYRWIYSQLEKQLEKVKDELITFSVTVSTMLRPLPERMLVSLSGPERMWRLSQRTLF